MAVFGSMFFIVNHASVGWYWNMQVRMRHYQTMTVRRIGTHNLNTFYGQLWMANSFNIPTHSSAFPRSRLSSGKNARGDDCLRCLNSRSYFLYGKWRGLRYTPCCHAHPWGSALKFQIFSAVGAVRSLDGEQNDQNGNDCRDLEPPRIGVKMWLWHT